MRMVSWFVLFAASTCLLSLQSCSRKCEGIHNFEKQEQGKKLMLINFINGCSNNSSNKISNVFKYMADHGRFSYNPAKDYIVFTSFENHIRKDLNEIKESGINQSIPMLFPSLEHFYMEAKFNLRISYPTKPQLAEVMPLMHYLSFDQMFKNSTIIQQHHFDRIEVVNISSYFNQPTINVWSNVDLSTDQYKNLLPITFYYLQKKDSLLGFTFGSPGNFQGFTYNTATYYASQLPVICKFSGLNKAFKKIVEVKTLGDSIVLQNSRLSYTGGGDTISLLKLNRIALSSSEGFLPDLSHDSSVFITFLAPARLKQKLQVEATIRIKTYDPLLGQHTLVAVTNPIVVKVGAGIWPEIKKYSIWALWAIFGIVFIIILSVFVLYLIKRFLSEILKVLDKMKNLWIALWKWLFQGIWLFKCFVFSHFSQQYQMHLVLGDTYGNVFVFNMHYLRLSDNYLGLHLKKMQGSYTLLADSSSVDANKHYINKVDISVKYELFILDYRLKNQLHTLPEYIGMKSTGKRLFYEYIKHGVKKTYQFPKFLGLNNFLTFSVLIHQLKDGELEEMSIYDNYNENEFIASQAALAFNIHFPALAHKILIVSMMGRDSLTVNFARSDFNNPFSVSVVLSLQFWYSAFIDNPAQFSRAIQKIMADQQTKNVVICYDKIDENKEKLISYLHTSRWRKYNSMINLFSEILQEPIPSIQVKTRPSPYFVSVSSYSFPLFRKVLRNPITDNDESKRLDSFMFWGINLTWTLSLSLTKSHSGFSKQGKKKIIKNINGLMLQPESERFTSNKYSDDYPFNHFI